MTAKKREQLSVEIKNRLPWAISEVSVETIERINILQASLLAMRQASDRLTDEKTKIFLAIDGNKPLPDSLNTQEAVIGGDGQIFAIAAASIIAKVHRDSLMTELALQYPQYGFEKHKGYGTASHIKAIKEYGLSPIHRPSFCKSCCK